MSRSRTRADEMRPIVSVIMGMWLATRLHKTFWVWAPIFSFGTLAAITLGRLIYTSIAFYFEWRKGKHF